jgi:hypothetical protein
MQTQTTQRLAFTPAEFAAAFGRHPSWAYRQLYAGKVHAISEFGRTLIPTSELERVLSRAARYDPKPSKEKLSEENGTNQT